MTFFLLGIDHKTASVDLREAVYWKREKIAGFWADHTSYSIATFSTCNRLEIYGIAKNASEAREAVSMFKEHFSGYFSNSYIIFGVNNVFRHLARLASGLESQINGELQIFSQLADWADRKDLPRELSDLVRQSLFAGLKIRASAGLNRPEHNIAALLYKNLLEHNHSDDLLNVAIVGTGKIAQLFAHYKPQGVRLYFAAHKNIVKARELAEKSGGHSLPLKDLPELLLKADILISATSSPHRVFDKNYFSKIAVLRVKKLYIYDLSVPRAVDPETKNIDGIVLNNIDDLSGIFEKHNRSSEVILNESNFKNRYAPKPAGH